MDSKWVRRAVTTKELVIPAGTELYCQPRFKCNSNGEPLFDYMLDVQEIDWDCVKVVEK